MTQPAEFAHLARTQPQSPAERDALNAAVAVMVARIESASGGLAMARGTAAWAFRYVNPEHRMVAVGAESLSLASVAQVLVECGIDWARVTRQNA